jgi:hypothetical protein
MRKRTQRLERKERSIATWSTSQQLIRQADNVLSIGRTNWSNAWPHGTPGVLTDREEANAIGERSMLFAWTTTRRMTEIGWLMQRAKPSMAAGGGDALEARGDTIAMRRRRYAASCICAQSVPRAWVWS